MTSEGKAPQRRSTRVEVNGWICLDKPVGLTSTQAVSRLKRIFNAKKAGHAGTLDPLASGVLPVAFGEATKTVSIAQDGAKAYRFTVQWGVETDTDDSEGKPSATSDFRATDEAILACLPRFTGVISQVPPAYSAIKVDGERAYDLARDGETFTLAARDIEVHALDLVASDHDRATFDAHCGKGTYVRAIARDMGRVLGCLGHVTALRRLRVGPFTAEASTTFDALAEDAPAAMLPIEFALAEIPCVRVDRDGAAILRRGQKLLLRGRDAPAEGLLVWASAFGDPVALGTVEGGYLAPSRVFNLGQG
jgi:tRNA pseudouridine55 synthase